MVAVHPALGPLFVDYLSVRQPLVEPALFVRVHGRRQIQELLGHRHLDSTQRYKSTGGLSTRLIALGRDSPALRNAPQQ